MMARGFIALFIFFPNLAICHGILASSFPKQEYNFEGIVALSRCSGSLARFENSRDQDQALVLTNGHCFLSKPTLQFYDRSQISPIEIKIFAKDGHVAGIVKTDRLEYSTMAKTDLTIYRLHETYGEIQAKYGVQALTISSRHPVASEQIQIISGYWSRGWSCQINSFIDQLREGSWIWQDSIRYTSTCQTFAGTSGSPILISGTRIMVGLNNTSNRLGKKCEINNPCEFKRSTGEISFSRGQAYGQQTYLIYSCLNENQVLDLSIPGCLLPH